MAFIDKFDDIPWPPPPQKKNAAALDKWPLYPVTKYKKKIMVGPETWLTQV